MQPLDLSPLAIRVCGLTFPNPFMLSAGPPTDDVDMLRRAFDAGWHTAVLKTTAMETENIVRRSPVIARAGTGSKAHAWGNIDAISVHPISEVEKRIERLCNEYPEKVVIGSITARTESEWKELAKRVKGAGAKMVEVSTSCPGATFGSERMLGQNPDELVHVTEWLKQALGDLPLIIKLAPQVTDIREPAMAALRGGADLVCISDSQSALLGVDVLDYAPIPAVRGRSTLAGLTGPGIKTFTYRNLRQVSRVSDRLVQNRQLIACGGMTTWKDAFQALLLGASLVQFCTAIFLHGYDLIQELEEGLALYCLEQGITSIQELVGASLEHVRSPEDLQSGITLKSSVDEETCIGCGRCVRACRDGWHQALALDPVSRRISVDETRCVGCGFCASVCPTGSIRLVEREN